MCTVVIPLWVATRTAPGKASSPTSGRNALELDGRGLVGTELGRRPLPDDPTGMHDRYPVGQLLGLLEVVGR